MHFRILSSLLVLTAAVAAYPLETEHGEPRCFSRYDFEEKLLEKAIRTEMMVQEYMTKLNDAIENINVQRDEIKDIKNTLLNITDELEKTNKHDKHDKKTPTVVFNAKSVTQTSPTSGDTMVFSSVLSNIGGAYSASTGQFTAPVDGTYGFTVQFCLYKNVVQFSLVLDGNDVATVEDYNGNHYSTASTTVPLLLNQGQKVWVRSKRGCTPCLYQHSTCWNRFSGLLIH